VEEELPSDPPPQAMMSVQMARTVADRKMGFVPMIVLLNSIPITRQRSKNLKGRCVPGI
jgi:hypothetical protein